MQVAVKAPGDSLDAARPVDSCPHVLVVEDNPELRELIVLVLESEGYKAEAAEDAADARRLLAESRAGPERPRLVLLDMPMPYAPGPSVSEAVVRLGSSVPVVAMSDDSRCLESAVAAGAWDTLEKPFDIDVLLTVVRRHCAA
jgi:two-component system nitrogen regulation response regulator NtrX